MANAQEVYTSSVKSLPASERLRLATLILDELSQTAAPILDFSDVWSDEDLHDFSSYSLRHATKTCLDANEP